MSSLKASTRALIKEHKRNFPGVKNKYQGVRQQILAQRLRERGKSRAEIITRIRSAKLKGKPVG